ncbi:glycoside hydrolase family 114 protein [Piromyces sp. E2]|nr:glycoside hydrolase family 114 protein [Piromyces sp. E2]|eukprot:OUM61686.1 glycoside hydrolase family 114 protein [Piromyces sp. E2]
MTLLLLLLLLYFYFFLSEASNKQVVTIDLEYAEKYVPYFHQRGQKVVCYFSGGTTEHRKDQEDYEKANIIIKTGSDDGWGNYWLDIKNKEKLQPLIRKRFKRAYSYGCDGVEVDCLGIYHYHKEYTKEDTYEFAKWVAQTGHEENVSVGLKNNSGIASRLEPYFDFAIVESCASYSNECNRFKPFTDNNKAVFIVHYGNLGWKLSGSKLSTLIKEQGGRGFTCVISEHQYLQTNSINYNCDTGAIIGNY